MNPDKGGLSRLREELAAKELALLELRSSSMLEVSNLRDQMRKRDLALEDSRAEVRQLSLALQDSESRARTEASARGSEAAELSEHVKSALHEIARLRERSTASERHHVQLKEGHEKEVAALEAAAARRSREIQVLMARVQALSEQADSAATSEIKWRQRVSAASGAVAKMQAEREETVGKLEEAARRYHAKAGDLERSRAERERLERELAESREEGTRLADALAQHRKRTEGLERRLGHLESAASRASKSAAALARDSERGRSGTNKEDDEQLSVAEAAAVRAELQRCAS